MIKGWPDNKLVGIGIVLKTEERSKEFMNLIQRIPMIQWDRLGTRHDLGWFGEEWTARGLIAESYFPLVSKSIISLLNQGYTLILTEIDLEEQEREGL